MTLRCNMTSKDKSLLYHHPSHHYWVLQKDGSRLCGCGKIKK